MTPTPEYRQLEQQVGEVLQHTPLALEPDPAEVQQLDQELPEEWGQTLEQEQEYTPEELGELLDAPLDIPDGDIDQNAQYALNELHEEGTLDFEAITQEIKEPPEIEIDYHQGIDFDR